MGIDFLKTDLLSVYFVVVAIYHLVVVVGCYQFVGVDDQQIAPNESEYIFQAEALLQLVEDLCVVYVLQVHQVVHKGAAFIASLYALGFVVLLATVLQFTWHIRKADGSAFRITDPGLQVAVLVVDPASSARFHPTGVHFGIHNYRIYSLPARTAQ